jgi:hypothetical protein
MEEGQTEGHSLWEAQESMRAPFEFSPARGNTAFASATFGYRET